MSTRIVSLTLLVLLAGLAVCGDDDDASGVTLPDGSDNRIVVKMRDSVFFSANVVVDFGDTVKWVSAGNLPHTATRGTGCTGDGLWESVSVCRDGQFMVIFDINHVKQKGTFPCYGAFRCPSA
jgi:plastocyanin